MNHFECPACHGSDFEILDDEGDSFVAVCNDCGFEATNREQLGPPEGDEE